MSIWSSVKDSDGKEYSFTILQSLRERAARPGELALCKYYEPDGEPVGYLNGVPVPFRTERDPFRLFVSINGIEQELFEI